MKKLETRFSFLCILCASVTTLVGVVALAGWLGSLPFLIQLTPLAFIQANTALCFILSGIALLAVNRSYFRATRILSLFIFTIGALTLCQYLFGINLGIDELLFRDFILSGTSHPNRMAPNTALCFFLFATALFIFSYELKKPLGDLCAAVLGAMIFVLASIALSGFMVGLEEAFGWGQMTRMSPQTALTFLFASGGIICLAWKNAIHLEKGFPNWSSSFASVLVLTIFTGIWQSLVIGERLFIKSDIRLMHEAVVSKINFELKERVLAQQRMGRRFEVNFSEENYQIEWEADVVNYLNHFGNFKSVNWVDHDYFVRWTVAPDGDEGSYGKNLFDDYRLAPTMNAAMESRDARISMVYNTPENEKVFSVFEALFDGGKFIGFIRGNFFLEGLLENVFPSGEIEVQSSIYDDGKLVLFRSIAGETADPEKWMISSAIDYKGLKWVVQCVPGKKYISKMRSSKPEIVMFFGLLLAWALGTAIRSRQKARTHELELTVINETLAKEYSKGQEQSKALEVSEKKYKALFNNVKGILEDVSRESGKKLYASLVKNLAVALGCKYCMVGELDPEDDSKVRTLAVWGDSNFMENFIYDLPGTPCENVVCRTPSCHTGDVWKKFPADKMLRDLSVKAYVGVPLNDSSKNPLGILCIMHDETVADLAHVQLILSLFAGVAESEMERQLYEKQLQWETKVVQLSRDIAMAANDLPDAEDTLTFALKRVCQFIGWPVGHLYLKEDSSLNLVPTRLWYFEEPSTYEVLKTVTEQTTFAVGVGLPGRVMAMGHPEWVRDVYADANFPRAKKSDQLGIRSALASPIILRKEVVGVMEFFTPRTLGVDWEVLDLVEQVGTQVGRVLERKKSEEILRQQAQVLDQIHDAVISMDTKYNITAWNKGAERVFGFEAGEMLGKPFADLLPDGKKILQKILIQPAIINERYEREMVATKKSGEIIYVHMSLSALCDKDCVPQSLICYALDVSEKKKVQVALEEYSQNLERRVEQRTVELNASIKKIKESRDQTEGILKSIGEGLIVTDLTGTIVLMNFAAESILGVKVGDALGRVAEQTIKNHSLLRQLRYEGDEKIFEKPFDFELQKDDKSLGRKSIQGVSTPIRGERGNLVGSVTILRDVTFERKVDSLKSQFLSTAAHELRTPLTTLQGFSEVLLHKKNLPAESIKRYLRYINEESLKLGKIINDFLDISRIESGREIAIDKKPCAVYDIIDRSAKMLGEAHQASHEFVFQCQPQTLEWKVDLEKMEQVFKNLYSNAIKYSPKGGKITTSARNVNNHIEVVVEDQGAGMTEEEVSKIFNKFYRGENVGKDVPGSGLGMTIVKYILEAHGGNVKVESGSGRGTRVIVCIPNC